MSYIAKTTNNVITKNTTILADGFSCLFFKNTGVDPVYINDNILITTGSSFSFDNMPYVTIGEPTTIMFGDTDANKKLLVIKTYFKPVK